MKRHWISFMLTGAITLSTIPTQPVKAQSVYAISASHAQGQTGSTSPVIKVWPGYGTNLSFLPTGETIVRVWIDDPSRIALDFDQPLCPTAIASDCESGEPTIIHLRRIQGLTFDHLPRANGTLLTVITETAGGERQLYEFRIELATGTPDYHTVEINPASSIHPLLGLRDIQRGIEMAESRALIHRDQDLWQRLQIFLSLARQGLTIPTAAAQAGVSLPLIARLADWGAQARDPSILDITHRSLLTSGADHEQTTPCPQATPVNAARAGTLNSVLCPP